MIVSVSVVMTRLLVRSQYSYPCGRILAIRVALTARERSRRGSFRLVEQEGTPGRARITLAAGAVVLLVAIVAIVVVAGGGEDEAVAAAPSECVRAWNSDGAAVAFGRHNYNGHGYQGALVTYLDEQAQEVDSADLGLCAVVFPAQALDPEPIAAGEVLKAGSWTPISELDGVELTRVGELQVIAAGAPNASLDDAGRLTAL